MPYNNTPITPSTEITGTVALPLARVKKIIHTDDDIQNCSNNAAFAITTATELFLQYLVEQTQNVVKTEKKPRRNIQYKDVASAVARVDNLEFLTDVVPKTVSYREFKAKKSKDAKEAGQTTLPGASSTATANVIVPIAAVVPVESDPAATSDAVDGADAMTVEETD